MKTVGVTGGIGSGKSSLCRMLESFGARVFSADDEAKRLMNEDPELRRRLIDAFGPETYGDDGRIDRAYLARRIFSDPDDRRRMNGIVHPAVRAAFQDFAEGARREGVKVVVREAALITGTEHELDEVVVVEAPDSARVQRVAARDDADETDVRSRIEAQPSPEEFRAVADRVVVNDGSLEDLEREARRMWDDWRTHDDAAIPIGRSVPRRGHRTTRAVVTGTMRLFGWRFAGRIPDHSRMVVIGGPHTSNWDLLLAMCVVFGLGLNFHWLGKHTIFRGPFGWLFRWAGGFPVDRGRPGGVIMEIVRRFEADEPFVLALSPEGTRSAVDRWKPGFHRIAHTAGVPILPGTIDYRRRVVEFHDPVMPTDDFDEDVRRLKSVFDSVTPKRPDRYRVLERDA